MPASAAKQIERKERVNEVLAWLCEYREPSQITSDGVRMWGVDERTIRRYVGDAHALKGQLLRGEATQLLGEVALTLLRYAHRAEKNAVVHEGTNLGVRYQAEGRASLESLCRLVGLNAPVQVEDVTKERPMHEWPTDMLTTRYAELRGNGGAGAH